VEGFATHPVNLDYTGVDISPDLVRLAKSRYPDDRPESPRRFLVADLRSLPFRDREFEWVVCRSVEGMIRDNAGQDVWEKMEKELRRVGKRLLLISYPETVGDQVVHEVKRGLS
jgi:ubiquinone/menaquinone biosynthesis C-methylase UbiE